MYLHNGDLNNDLEKIFSNQESFESDEQKMAVSKEVDFNLDYPYAIDVEDESYFYANEKERNEDYIALCFLLNENSSKFIYS
jgi:hypothetical protein